MALIKPVKGYEGLYSVTDRGEVIAEEKVVFNGRGYGKRKRKVLKQGLRGRGNLWYKHVILSKDGVSKAYSVHRLVAEAFIENPNNYPEINHKDRNTFNNSVDNLEWCTRQYNIEYSKNKKITQYLNGIKIADYESATIASKITKIGRTSISNCLVGLSKKAGGFEWEYCDI